MDVEDVAPGQNFAQKIDETMAACDAALIVIGPRWMEILRKRLQESQPDYVCHEIASALEKRITIVPVLVGGASMAQLTELPEKLAGLPLHQAAELRDNTFKEDCTRLARALSSQPGLEIREADNKTDRKRLFTWMAVTVALLGLLFALSKGPWSEYQARKATIRRLMATARTQMDQAEYQSAFKTYQDALKVEPANGSAMDLQADAAMLWLQDFHLILGEGQKAEDIAGPPLVEIMSVLHAGLARTNGKGSRASDIMAHLGWAHWLNQHLAFKEFGPAAERDLRQALSIDPSNVFAHAMLGNWLLQTNGSVEEALRHFEMAVKTNNQRALVRQMQLGALVYKFDPGMRSELIKVANQMRIGGESIGERTRRRILSSYNPGLNSDDELKETLSAVPTDDAWATFLWLNDKQPQGSDLENARIQREFIRARISELDGKRSEALGMFKGLERELSSKGYNGRIAGHVARAIKRLSR